MAAWAGAESHQARVVLVQSLIVVDVRQLGACIGAQLPLDGALLVAQVLQFDRGASRPLRLLVGPRVDRTKRRVSLAEALATGQAGSTAFALIADLVLYLLVLVQVIKDKLKLRAVLVELRILHFAGGRKSTARLARILLVDTLVTIVAPHALLGGRAVLRLLHDTTAAHIQRLLRIVMD